MSHSPDEAQLTAYLLGELSPEETTQVEAQLAVSAALRDELAGLRQTVAALEAALADQTPPAIPALDREKLHSLLQSAVVTSHEPSVMAPALLATAPSQPARGSTSRGWLVAAAVLVVGGLVGLSQIEPPTGWTHTSREQELRRDIARLRAELGYDGITDQYGENLVRSDLSAQLKGYAGDSTSGPEPENTSLDFGLDAEKAQFLAIQAGQDNRVEDRKSNGSKVKEDLTSLVQQRDFLVAAKSGESARWQDSNTSMSAETRARLKQELKELNAAMVQQRGQIVRTSTSALVSNARGHQTTPEELLVKAPLEQRISGGTTVANATTAHPSPDGTVVDYGLASSSLSAVNDVRFRFIESNNGDSQRKYFLTLPPQVHTGRVLSRNDAHDGTAGFFGRFEESVTNRQWFAKGKPASGEIAGRFGTEAAGGRGGVTSVDRAKASLSLSRGLQLGEGLAASSSEALYSNFVSPVSQLGDQLTLFDRVDGFDMDGEPGLSEARGGQVALGVTPRIIIEQEEDLLTDLHLVDESKQLADKESEAGQQTTLPALTVANYENGFVQLGAAVKGWGEFSQHWSFQGDEALAREAKVDELVRPAIQELEKLSQVVEDQTRALQELREKTPENAEKPLAEVDAKAAQEAQLALVRVSRELQRQQRVWYYREGYIRDLEATIAAAEQYAHVPENDFVTPEAQPLSTFGIDVDTASYSNVRRFVESGQLPPPDAVRIEELINSFQYEGPKVEGEHPLAIAAEVSACPWQPQHQLLRVALKGKSIDLQQRPPARLVFLVDTSGSMSDQNKLPLVKQSLRILVDQMREQDRLSIVTYSDNAGLLLDSTGGDKRETILAAIEGLHSDGSTNGEAGLKLAYEVAVKQFGEGATNRVMLCTDGDFNVGESADDELVKLIEKQRQTGVFLNIFGFGSGNLKDAKLEAIADKGNGQYIYIDGIKEARKTLLNELTGTLYTIAKDVKLQIEFNPNLVGSYRLVGYENRAMAARDFSNDKVDSGDMGAGHSVVALYEIVPPGAPQPVAPQPQVEPLKYQKKQEDPSNQGLDPSDKSRKGIDPSTLPGEGQSPDGKPTESNDKAIAQSGSATPQEKPSTKEGDKPSNHQGPPADPLATELCTIRVRYKQPTSNESTKIETAVHHPLLLLGSNAPISRDHVWATAVAQFGLLARHSTFVGTGNYSQVLELAQSAIGDDPTGQRREFVTLVRQMQSLSFERERQLAEISRRAEEHRRVIEEIKTVEKAPDVMTKASCSGKYRTLLRRIEVADDQPTYGEFKDWGRWDGATYKTHQNLPHGYWVYVAPHWYIWGESTEQAAVDTTK